MPTVALKLPECSCHVTTDYTKMCSLLADVSNVFGNNALSQKLKPKAPFGLNRPRHSDFTSSWFTNFSAHLINEGFPLGRIQPEPVAVVALYQNLEAAKVCQCPSMR